MTTTPERIHINEAVRLYNKTRQTFYNWIRKGLLQSQKRNNKVYISTKNIEQLINDDYLVIDQPTPISSLTEEVVDEETIYELLTELHEQKYDLLNRLETQKVTLDHDITMSKQELWTDIQRAAEGMQLQINTLTEKQHTLATTLPQGLLSRLERLTLTTKKHRFWIGYFLFILVNATILSFL